MKEAPIEEETSQKGNKASDGNQADKKSHPKTNEWVASKQSGQKPWTNNLSECTRKVKFLQLN